MKSLTLTILVVIISFNGISQLTYVPDDNFEKLIETSFPNASNGVVNDNYVLTSGLITTVLGITSSLGQISDFTGLQDFSNLKLLQIHDLALVKIDLSNLNLKRNTFYNLSITNCPIVQEIKLPHGAISFEFFNLPYLNNLVFQTDNILYYSNGISLDINSCNSLTNLDISNISDVEIGAQLFIQLCNHLTCVNLKNGKCNKWAKVMIGFCR